MHPNGIWASYYLYLLFLQFVVCHVILIVVRFKRINYLHCFLALQFKIWSKFIRYTICTVPCYIDSHKIYMDKIFDFLAVSQRRTCRPPPPPLFRNDPIKKWLQMVRNVLNRTRIWIKKISDFYFSSYHRKLGWFFRKMTLKWS